MGHILVKKTAFVKPFLPFDTHWNRQVMIECNDTYINNQYIYIYIDHTCLWVMLKIKKIIFLRQKNSNIIHNVGLFSETHCRCFEKVTGDVASIADTYYEVSVVRFTFLSSKNLKPYKVEKRYLQAMTQSYLKLLNLPT